MLFIYPGKARHTVDREGSRRPAASQIAKLKSEIWNLRFQAKARTRPIARDRTCLRVRTGREARSSVTPVGIIRAMTSLLLLVTFLAVWEFPPSRALAQSAHHGQLIEGAKKEGQLNWYTSMSVVDHTKYFGIVQ
jgi:hypothetical protein